MTPWRRALWAMKGIHDQRASVAATSQGSLRSSDGFGVLIAVSWRRSAGLRFTEVALSADSSARRRGDGVGDPVGVGGAGCGRPQRHPVPPLVTSCRLGDLDVPIVVTVDAALSVELATLQLVASCTGSSSSPSRLASFTGCRQTATYVNARGTT